MKIFLFKAERNKRWWTRFYDVPKKEQNKPSEFIAKPDPTATQPLYIGLHEGFTGNVTRVFVDGVRVFEGKPFCNPTLGRAKGLNLNCYSNSIVLKLEVPAQSISFSQVVDLTKGVGVGVSITSNKVELLQKNAFGYD